MSKLVLKIASFREEWAKYSASQTTAYVEFVHIYFCGIRALNPIHVAKL